MSSTEAANALAEVDFKDYETGLDRVYLAEEDEWRPEDDDEWEETA